MHDFAAIFDALPGNYLILSPDFIILGANRAYLKATQTSPEIIGRPLFDVFPDNPDDPRATGVKELTASLRKVLLTGQQDVMPILRYDTRLPGSSRFRVRYWKPVNIPVTDDRGGIKYIIISVEEVTDLVLLRKDLKEKDSQTQKQITDAILTTQELERMEISQELHDNVNQILNTARLYLERAMQSPPDNEGLLQQGHALVAKAIEEVKKLSLALLHLSTEEQHLTTTLEQLLEEVIVLKQINVFKTFQLPDEALIESKLKTTVIRIVQEQLANVVKHSGARNLYIDLAFRDNQLELNIRDDGKGFDMDQPHKGLGFQNMRNRAALMDGRVLISSYPGDGCQIKVTLPLAPE